MKINQQSIKSAICRCVPTKPRQQSMLAAAKAHNTDRANMWKFFLRRGFLFTILSTTPTAALAAAAPTDFKSLADLLVDIIRTATVVIVGLGFVYYLWGIALALKEGGSAKGWEKFRTLAPWGILIIFVMVSVWQILRVLSNTLFPTS